jgi:penicillin-binding protein 1B
MRSEIKKVSVTSDLKRRRIGGLLSGRIRRSLFVAFAAAAILGFSVLAYLFYSYLSFAKLVDARLASGYLSSRAGIYAAPRTLRVGQALNSEELVDHLRRAGYVETSASDAWNGSFNVDDHTVEIRPTHTLDNAAPSIVKVGLDSKGRISSLIGDGVSLESFALEPEVLTSDASMKSGVRTALGYQELPPVLVNAILSTEDRRFFEHSGVDFWGIIRAAMRNAGDERVGQGGSTITQQLVKNTYLSPERTLKRKFSEAMISFVLERRLTKQDIFALYCNEIYLGQRGGAGVHGVEQAARIYFGKDVQELTLSEAALIAGMIQSPNRYAPDRHPETAVARRNIVLAGMVRDGAITLEQAAASSKEPLSLATVDLKNGSLAPYFIDYVNRGLDAATAGGDDGQGLRVFTTLDPDLQRAAEQAVGKQLDRLDKIYKNGPHPEAALVALDPKTGDVLAMVGGRSYVDSQLNRATDAMRQPGSVFKPIVYSAAIESGISPLTMFQDAPREFIYDGRAKYRPANFGGGYSMHDVTMRSGLIRSLNVVTVDVAFRAGLQNVAALAQNFGLQRPLPFPAMALGTTEASPLAIASAYSAFANEGKLAAPRLIKRAADTSGRDIIASTPQVRQVLDPRTAFMVTDMLSGVIDHGTARAARGALKQTAFAGKTGTSRDGWFVGFTPNLVVAVWIGFDDNKQLGLTGAEAALPAWVDFMKNAVALRPELGGRSFDRPSGINFIEIDPETGLRAVDSCPQRERVALTPAFIPGGECYIHVQPLQPLAENESVPDPFSSPDTSEVAKPMILSREAGQLRQTELRNGNMPDIARTTRVTKRSDGVSILVTDLREPD